MLLSNPFHQMKKKKSTAMSEQETRKGDSGHSAEMP